MRIELNKRNTINLSVCLLIFNDKELRIHSFIHSFISLIIVFLSFFLSFFLSLPLSVCLSVCAVCLSICLCCESINLFLSVCPTVSLVIHPLLLPLFTSSPFHVPAHELCFFFQKQLGNNINT